jgi:hypothetical protein
MALATAIAAAVLGALSLVSGLALWPALMLASQPLQQTATSLILVSAGLVNLTASRGIRRGHLIAILASAAVTAGFIGYSLWVLRDMGEFFWLHVVYLAALGASFRGAPAAS